MKKFIALIITLSMLLMFTACESATVRLIYDLDDEPYTLDPQYAYDSNALTIISNTFEGLFTEDIDGNLVNGVIEYYDVSSDGLTYTFILKENLEWSNGYPLTAYDFEFSFQRLFDPNTNSSTCDTLFCIKNSESIRNGKASVDSLGVTAVSDTELVIELDYINSMFLELLATAPAMPCNEQFFNETKGEYGLEVGSIISNGAFEVTVWYHSEYMKLMKNSNYHDSNSVQLNNMTLWLGLTEDEKLERFENDSSHCITFEGNIEDTFSNVSKLAIETKVDTTWGIIFNTDDQYFSNENLRKSISACIDRERVENDMPSYLQIADYLIPDIMSSGEYVYREYVEENYGYYGQSLDLDNALSYYDVALEELGIKKLGEIFITIPESIFIEHETYFTNLSQIIQKELNLFIGLDVVSESEYNSKISSGNYTIAISNIEAEYNNPIYMLSTFTSDSGYNISNYNYSEYDDLISSSLSQQSVEQSIEYLKKAEENLLQSAVFIPLYYQEDFLILNEIFVDIQFSEKSGLINFKFTKMN